MTKRKGRARTGATRKAEEVAVAPPAPAARAWPARRTAVTAAIGAALALGAVLVVFGSGWVGGGSVSSRPLEVAAAGRAGFSLLPAEQTGITFVNDLAPKSTFSSTFGDNGSGVALGDYDGDGLCDVYFSALEGDNVLYRNLGGWRFEDVTAKAGVACPGDLSTGTAFADADGDGDLDLFVSKLPGLRYFRNNGDGTFTESTAASGLNNPYGNMSIALADVEGDGDLDLYVASYRTDSLKDSDSFKFKMVDGKLTIPPELRDRLAVVEGRLQELGEPDVLYLNDGKGRFSAVSWTGGAFLDEDGERLAGPPLGWGLGVSLRDMDGDGDPDLYVCNDFASPDTIMTNLGDGRFRAVDPLAIRSTSATSMGVDFADVDRDGDVDLFVGDMRSRDHAHRSRQMPTVKPSVPKIGILDDRPQIPRNTLLLNRGDGTYAEVANVAGVSSTGWSWTTLFVDVDLDGYEDLFVANGFTRDVQDADANDVITAKLGEQGEMGIAERQAFLPRLDQPNVAFRNLDGLRFEEHAREWGLDAVGISHGAALGDLDGDGDLDLVVNNFQMPAGVYRNESPAPRVTVRLEGDGANTRGIGAKVRLVGGPVEQSREIGCGGEYLSSSEPLAVFAAGDAQGGMRLEVTWRDGAQSVVDDVRPNTHYTIGKPRWGGDVEPPARPDPIFEDATARLNHSHRENEFDDFARQPLLPNRLSQLGPGVAWHDLDGDGDDDLVVATGKDGRTGVLVNDGRGGFLPAAGAGGPSGRDQTAVVAFSDATGGSILAGSASYEDGAPDGESVARYTTRGSALEPAPGVAGQPSSTGPLAMADVDGDGDLDLFAGGRMIPGRYPEAASSALLRNDGGQFSVDAASAPAFASLGLVSGATFSDLDGDGDPDLALALEWGPVSVFLNEGGAFTNATERLGLAALSGRWNGIATGDLDGDGRPDLVATNWGRNNSYPVDATHPAVLLYGDVDGNGTLDLFEAYYEGSRLVPERNLEQMSRAIPGMRSRFPTYASYGASDVFGVFGPGADVAPRVTAATLEHTVFFNRGDRFEAAPMPVEAQFAPGFGVVVADFDGDGNEDVFVAQNFFAVRPSESRWDAGRGLLLRGDGKGGLAPVPGHESGVMVYGEARGAAVGDYDGDGRVDLVVAQNGAATRLFRNRLAKPGLRVRLAGPAANPNGVGAAVRLVWGERQGPIREVQAGSGYWSQSSSTLVMGAPEPPTAVWVRWPGGDTTTTPVPSGATEIVVEPR